jgi:hypothetical protein
MPQTRIKSPSRFFLARSSPEIFSLEPHGDFAMTDRVFADAGDWAVASDGIQWILQRRQGGQWRAVSFVRSTRDILARCMREKGVEAAHSALLLSGLPDTFDKWKTTPTSPKRLLTPSAETADGGAAMTQAEHGALP